MGTIKELTVVYAFVFTIGAALEAGRMFTKMASKRFVRGWNGPDAV